MFKQILLCLVLVPSTVAASKQALGCAVAFTAINMAASAQGSQMSGAYPFPTHLFAQAVKDVGPSTGIDWRMFEWPLIASADQIGAGWRQWDVSGAPGYDLPISIVSWLTENFDLPPIYNRPEILISVATKLTAPDSRDLGEPPSSARRIPAIGFYDDATRRVHVGDGWNPETAGGQSILVHQIVYHLQNLAGLKYECPQARARVAYEAQMRWLGRTGRTLEREFGIDPEVLLLSTECHTP
jgi:hypothetical protein